MKAVGARFTLISWIIRVAVVAAITWSFVERRPAFAETDAVPHGGPVVIELFTSEGCSSCPPADALLSEIGSSNKGVIPLAYHVDYWNYLGWSDPFSSRQFSERQSVYARAMGLGSEYTPQMVIEGSAECLGSDAQSISRAVAAASSGSTLVRVNLRTRLGGDSPRKLYVTVSAQPAVAETRRAEVMLATFENGLVSKIGGGENGGREITYDYTVRRLLPAFELEPRQRSSVDKELPIDLDPSWSLNHLGVAAFVQDTESHRILGAASKYPVKND